MGSAFGSTPVRATPASSDERDAAGFDGEVDVGAADPVAIERQWHDRMDDLAEEIEEIVTGTGRYLTTDAAELPGLRQRAERKLVLLMAFKPLTWDELIHLDEIVEVASEKEADTLAAVGDFGARAAIDPMLNARAFPSAWAERLRATMRPVLEVDAQRRARERAWEGVIAAGEVLPPYLVGHGLPVTFDEAMDLENYTILWEAAGLPAGHPLRGFLLAGAAYLDAYSNEQLAIRYAGGVQQFIASVAAGDQTIDVALWERYSFERRWAPTVSDLTSRQAPVNPLGSGEDANPFLVERNLYERLEMLRVLDVFSEWKTVHDEFERREAEADQRLAGQSRLERLLRARQWADERHYGSYVRDFLWAELKKSAPGMLKDAAKEGAVIAIAQLIPVVNVLVDVGLAVRGAWNAGAALWRLAEAENDVKEANTIVKLERATAHLVLAEHTEMLQLVGSLLEVYGSWSAMRKAMRPHGDAPAVGGKASKTAAEEAAASARFTKADAAARTKLARAARADADAAEAWAKALRPASRLQAVIVPGAPEFGRLVYAVYLTVKRKILGLEAFLASREAKRLLGELGELAPDQVRLLQEAYDLALAEYNQVFTRGKALGMADSEVHAFLRRRGETDGLSVDDLIKEMEAWRVTKDQGVPFGFNGIDEFARFRATAEKELAKALKSVDGDAKAFLQGSSLSGVSFTRQVPFDASSDFDIAVVSRKLLKKAEALGYEVSKSPRRIGPLDADQVAKLGLNTLRDRLAKVMLEGVDGVAGAERKINFMLFDTEQAMSKPLGDSLEKLRPSLPLAE
jgi:hypothetical protein